MKERHWTNILFCVCVTTQCGREREALRGETTATTVTKKNENYFIWIKRSQEWYTDSINPSRSLSIFEASPGWVQLNNESNRHDKRIFFVSIVVVVGFCGGSAYVIFNHKITIYAFWSWAVSWRDRSLFLKLVHTYVTLIVSLLHSLIPYSSILCHQIEYHQIFVG